MLGAVAALAVLAICLALLFALNNPPGGFGENLMGASIIATELGWPTSNIVVALSESLDGKSAWFLSVYPLALAAVALNGAVIGAITGYVWSRVRRPKNAESPA